MARYKLTLAYDGTAFSGSQRQTRHRSVQAELEKALGALTGRPARTVMAGRTDAGVHATGQVAAADLDWRHSVEALRDGLNAKLPPDVAVTGVEIVGDEFHPRFDAKSRRYRYNVLFGPVRDPLRERTTWRVWPPVDPVSLARSAECFLGQHDFGAFGTPSRRGGGTRRTVTMSEWVGSADECHYDVAAEGFLYRMVRRLVFIQMAVAHGKCAREAVVKALEAGHAGESLSPGLAPARGLVLVGVDY
jgi:tRNA pseudouridine38-40 synthase